MNLFMLTSLFLWFDVLLTTEEIVLQCRYTSLLVFISSGALPEYTKRVGGIYLLRLDIRFLLRFRNDAVFQKLPLHCNLQTDYVGIGLLDIIMSLMIHVLGLFLPAFLIFETRNVDVVIGLRLIE